MYSLWNEISGKVIVDTCKGKLNLQKAFYSLLVCLKICFDIKSNLFCIILYLCTMYLSKTPVWPRTGTKVSYNINEVVPILLTCTVNANPRRTLYMPEGFMLMLMPAY